ncbi:MAG: DnaB-like helicase N-terminal domain-containing protein, partial [Bacillaceae bacterium]
MYVGVDMTPEQAVLGCILSSGELIYEVTLQPYHFLVEKHRIIFSAMKELMAEDSAIDILLVTTKLVDKKLIEQVDGVSYLYNLTSSVATLANINHYEQLIFQAYREYAARELAA